MGTHPIFESDFDCLTEMVSQSNNTFDGSLEQIQESVAFVRSKIGNLNPDLGVVCGSGLGSFADELENQISIDYNEIPHMKKTGTVVQGHAGKLIIGTKAGKTIIAMKGRFHAYEGYPAWKISLPVRMMKYLGCTGVIVTNAAGALNESFNVGDFMIINDHLNIPGLIGFSPLIGANDDRIGPRFPSMGDTYDLQWRQIAKRAADDIGEEIKSGS